MNYYKVPIVDGAFPGIKYSEIVEGIAYDRHVAVGFGYVMTSSVLPYEEVTEEEFNAERTG